MEMSRSQYEAALAAVDNPEFDAQDKRLMLMQMAEGLQHKARSAAEFALADRLYEQALQWCDNSLDRARVEVARADALSMSPAADTRQLERARALLEEAMPQLQQGSPEEQAGAQMSLGLILQSLAAEHRASLSAAIAAYQKALQVFQARSHPLEFALLHNNLATAYLSMGPGHAGARVSEALAVQAFEAALEQLDAQQHPREYAMLQNNLGNALQYAASGQSLENNLRALQAYDEALKVRTEEASPLEYAATLANLGNCLANLPADAVDYDSQVRAGEALRNAERVFRHHGVNDRAEMVASSRQELGL